MSSLQSVTLLAEHVESHPESTDNVVEFVSPKTAAASMNWLERIFFQYGSLCVREGDDVQTASQRSAAFAFDQIRFI